MMRDISRSVKLYDVADEVEQSEDMTDLKRQFVAR